MNDDAILWEAVRQAQRKAGRRGLAIGQSVCHPQEPKCMELLEVRDDGTAIIGWEAERREFPLSELFDPNVAKDIACRLVLGGGFS